MDGKTLMILVGSWLGLELGKMSGGKHVEDEIKLFMHEAGITVKADEGDIYYLKDSTKLSKYLWDEFK